MRRFLAYLGVEFRDPHQQALQKLKQRRAEQIAAYQDGESIADLATSVGVGPMKMSGFLVAQGVELRHDSGR